MAPSSSTTRAFSVLPTVASTRMPRARATWIACVPIPPAPPWTRRVSPSRAAAAMNTLENTVAATSGSPAAATGSTPSGSGSTCSHGATARSA